MQALHFAFALGAFLAPLLAKLAFSSTESAEKHTEAQWTSRHPAPNQSEAVFGAPDNLNLLWAYALNGTYMFLISTLLLALFLKKSSRRERAQPVARRSRRARHHKALLCLLFLFFFFYVGAEVTYGSYVFSFATAQAGMKESEAAGLNSIFWGTFAACRGLAVFVAACLRPATMIGLSNAGSLLSSLLLVLFHRSRVCLWVATAGYGASMATTFPSGVSWIEQYTAVDGKAAAFFVVGAALGEMTIPALVGLLQRGYPDLPVVLYTCLGSALATGLLFPVLYKTATLPPRCPPRGHRKSEDREALLRSSGPHGPGEQDADTCKDTGFQARGGPRSPSGPRPDALRLGVRAGRQEP